MLRRLMLLQMPVGPITVLVILICSCVVLMQGGSTVYHAFAGTPDAVGLVTVKCPKCDYFCPAEREDWTWYCVLCKERRWVSQTTVSVGKSFTTSPSP